MVLTIALNPCVEKTAIVDGVEINEINNIQDYRLVLGPSAIYSALVVKLMQGEPYVLGFAGGIGGRYIKNFMDKNRIKSDLLWKDIESRSEIKIIDSINLTETKFLDNTFYLEEQDLKNYKHKLKNHIKNTNTIIINNGKLGDDISNKVIEETMSLALSNNLKMIISLSGRELRKSLVYKPYGIIINNNDLRELEIDSNEEKQFILEELKSIIIKNKIKYVVFDDGKNIYLISKNKICNINYDTLIDNGNDNINKDAIVGALAICVSRKYEMEKTIRLIVAIIISIKIGEYPNVLSRKNVDRTINKIKVTEIFNYKNGYLK